MFKVIQLDDPDIYSFWREGLLWYRYVGGEFADGNEWVEDTAYVGVEFSPNMAPSLYYPGDYVYAIQVEE